MAAVKRKDLNFMELFNTFIHICPDFVSEQSLDQPSRSRQFAEQVIFNFSAEIKNIKKSRKDCTWKVMFKSDDNTTTGAKKTKKFKIYISTYLFTKPPREPPRLEGNVLRLTFKQASLVAVYKYCQVVPLLVQNNEFIFTPLAGAVFTKEALSFIARDLSVLARAPVSLTHVLIAIICSCQTDGFFLPPSACHIAVAGICCTVTDANLRESLVRSVVKQYMRFGKPFNELKFRIYINYANKAVDINRILQSQDPTWKQEVNNHALPSTKAKKIFEPAAAETSSLISVDEAVAGSSCKMQPDGPQKQPTKEANEEEYGVGSNDSTPDGKLDHVCELLKSFGLLNQNKKQQNQITPGGKAIGACKNIHVKENGGFGKAKGKSVVAVTESADDDTDDDSSSTADDSSSEDSSSEDSCRRFGNTLIFKQQNHARD